jgi:putative transposase
VRRAKGCSSRKIQQEFEHIRKRYWGQRFWQRGDFSTTSGNITDDIIISTCGPHTHKDGFSRHMILLPASAGQSFSFAK